MFRYRSSAFRFPPGSAFPLHRPFSVCLAPPDDSGDGPAPLVPDDLTALDHKALARAERDLVKKGNALKDSPASAEVVANLKAVVEALGKVRTETARRAEESAQHEAEKAELLSALEPAAQEDPEDPDDEGEEDPEAPPAEPAAVPEPTPAAPAEPQGIAAAATPVRVKPRAPSVRNIPPGAIPPANQPKADLQQRARVSITAAGDVPGFSAGMPIDERDLGQAFTAKAAALLRGGGTREASVFSLHVDYPEERMLHAADSSAAIREKVDAVTASGARTRGLTAKGPNAVVAAGGLCAPVEVRYDFMTLGTERRPVRDSLVRFGAERGGIQFISPPHLSDVAPGVSLWTNATDAAWVTGAPTKPYFTVTCGTATTVRVDALVTSGVVGNFDRMTFPEHWEAWYKLARIQFGRVADSRLLDLIKALCTVTTGAQDLGAARDILVHVGTLADGYRDRNRMEPDEILQILLPWWTLGLMRADFTRQHPGDEAVGMADAEILGYFAAHHIETNLFLDSPSTGVAQNFTSQGGGGGPIEGYPGTVQGAIFAPGSFLHVDGGDLNLGAEIRDFTLDQRNQVAMFEETFENVAFIGVEADWFSLKACPNGWTAAAQSTPACGGS